MDTKLDVCLPGFPGFYESLLSGIIDHEIEYESECREADGFPCTWDDLYKEFDYRRAMLAVAQAWVDWFTEEYEIEVVYKSLESPKEYNFTTDRVFCTISCTEALRLWNIVKESPSFPATLERMFTSYDGFMSFYSNDPDDEEWQRPVTEWDHNQLQALLAAYVDHTHGAVDCWEIDCPALHEAASAGWNPSTEQSLTTA